MRNISTVKLLLNKGAFLACCQTSTKLKWLREEGELMIEELDKAAILRSAKKYNVSAVYLFGSTVESGAEAHDIDIGVKGLEPEYFFKFYGELIKYLSKPVDLVDLSEVSKFTKLVEETGLRIYG